MGIIYFQDFIFRAFSHSFAVKKQIFGRSLSPHFRPAMGGEKEER
jgi:hypothetical protein